MLKSAKAALNICMVLSLVLFGWTTISILLFPYGVDYGEAPLIDQARRIQNGEPLYKSDLSSPPYIIANYTPIYPLTVAAVDSILPLPPFQIGRAISWVSAILCAVVINALGAKLSGNRLAGLLAATLFLGHPYVMLWSSLARVDVLGLAFSLLAIYIVFKKWQSPVWLLVSVFFFLAAVYTRQTFLLAGPLACCAWLWYKNRRQFFIFLGSFCFTGLAIFFTLYIATNGGIYEHIILANLNRYDFARMISMGGYFLVLWPVILGLSIFSISYAIKQFKGARQKQQDATDEPAFLAYGWSAYTAGALVSAATVGKVGSDVNYFLELIVAGTIWAVVLLKLFTSSLDRKYQFLHVLLVLQLVWLLACGYLLNQTTIARQWERLEWYDDLYAQVQAAVTQGIVLSDDYLDMVVMAGQPIYYQPFEYGQLYHAGLWDAEQLSAEISSQRFPLILIGGDCLDKPCCWSPQLVQAIEEHYEIIPYPQLLLCRPSP